MTAIDPERVADRARALRSRLDRAGGEDVRVVAVTKTFPAAAIDAAVAAGIADIGENYAQECVAKLAEINTEPTVVDVWQTVDRIELGREIAKRAAGATVMVQVDISGEDTKGGCTPGDTPGLVAEPVDLGLEVCALMGVALFGEPEEARPGFALLRSLVDRLGLEECSMGMTADLEVAVGEGATIVRIGRDLFGERPR